MRRKFSAHQIAGVKNCAVHEAFAASGSSLSGFAGTEQLLPLPGVMDGLCVLQRCKGAAQGSPAAFEPRAAQQRSAWARQHLHHGDEQGSSCLSLNLSLQVLVMPCPCLLAFRTLERSRTSSAKDLTLGHWLWVPSAPRGLLQEPAATPGPLGPPTLPHFPYFSNFSGFEAGRTILPLATGSNPCLHRPSRIASPSQQLFPQPSGVQALVWPQSLRGRNLIHSFPRPNFRALEWAAKPDMPALFWGFSTDCCAHGWALCGEGAAAAPFWQAALSKARPQFLHIHPLCVIPWLTPSLHHLPQSHRECWVGDKGHGGIAGTGTAWQTPVSAGPQRVQGHGLQELLVSKSFLFFYFPFFFSCLLQKGPDAFTLAGLPWPGARGGTRNAVCECVCAIFIHRNGRRPAHKHSLLFGSQPGEL